MSTEHSFSIADAVRCGVEEAIIISNLRFWLAKNAANERHKHDGFYWTYNSARAFAELFPYWTSNKIQKLLKVMEAKGYIMSGVYNQSGYDRTKWYTLPEFSEQQVEERRNSIRQNGFIHSAKWPNENSQMAEPIPDVNTDKKPDVKTTLVVAEATTGEQEKSERVPFQKIQGIYNAVCAGTLPGCLTLNEKRKRNIRKCWNLQINGKYPFRKSEFWEGYFHDCLQNQHWTGNNERGWRAHLEFLTREENVLRVLEGQA